MSIVPTSIFVARFPQQPAQKLSPRCRPEPKNYEALGTVDVEITTSSTPAAAASDISLYETLGSIDQDTILYCADKRQFQPKISLQPDTTRYWSREAWTNRAVVGDDKLHVLFTTSTDGSNLTENRHVSGKVRGDVFVLQLSDKQDEHGRRYYEDLNPDDLDLVHGRWEDLAGKVERFMDARGQLMVR